MIQFEKNKHYSYNLERAILGACLIEKEAFGRIYSLIESPCFYSTYHQTIFETIRNMYVNGLPIDTFTVIDFLQRVKDIRLINNDTTEYFIIRLTNDVVSSANIEYHSYVVKTMWMERELIKLTSGGSNGTVDTRTKIQELQNKLLELQQKTITHDWQDMSALMVGLYQHQEEMKASKGIGLRTGIEEIDKENGGFHPGQMVVIGARPSVGKSALAGSIALHTAKNNHTVGIISLEMSNNEIAARLAAIDTNTDFSVLYRGLYRDEYQTRQVYEKIANHTSQLPIYVSDRTNVDVVEIRSKADKLKSLYGLDLLIIDYLQLIDVPEMYNRTRENEIAKVSRYTKIMAKELNIPVLLLCQLNRESTKRHGEARYPQLSDLRESGSIEQDADVVMFLHRDWMIGQQTNENGGSTEFEADLIIRKWRNGKNNFIVQMEFDPPKMSFVSRETTVNSWKPVDSELL